MTSDHAVLADDSDSDEVLYGIHDESQSEASDVAEDSDEEVVQQPPAKKGRSKALSETATIHTWKDVLIQPQVHQYTCQEITPDLLSLLPNEPKPLDLLSFFCA